MRWMPRHREKLDLRFRKISNTAPYPWKQIELALLGQWIYKLSRPKTESKNTTQNGKTHHNRVFPRSVHAGSPRKTIASRYGRSARNYEKRISHANVDFLKNRKYRFALSGRSWAYKIHGADVCECAIFGSERRWPAADQRTKRRKNPPNQT